MSTALQSEDLAFESLYRLHRPPVYAYALSTLRHPADAEDVTQTTFLNAYCALHRGVTPRDDLQWLLAIARNACRDRFRDAKRHPKEEPLADWIRLVQPEEPDYSVAEICKEISELNPRYRQILLMREFEGRSYAEISAQLGVSEPAVQTLLARARRALRDELELGMTCAHARRVALRHLNGVALRDERRALQRHLRRCADCSTFVGRTPRTPVTRMLWLVWVPYRRLMAIIAGTGAAQGSTAGAGALAAKILAITVVGSAAVGVTAKEVADGPGFGHHQRTPSGPAAVSPTQRSVVQSHGAAAAVTAWGTAAPAAGRAPLTHTSHHPAQPLPLLSSSSSVPIVRQTPTSLDSSSSSPAESAPAAVTAAGQTEVTPSAPPQDPVAVTDAAPGSTTAGATTASIPAADPSATAVTADVSASTSARAASAGSSSASAPSDPAAVPGTTPVTSPPLTTPTPPGQTPGNGNGNGNAVGQGGTPPGQANKPDQPPHGRG